MSDEIAGIDVDGVTNWFAEHVPEAEAPLTFDLIAGGHSNLTFGVTDQRGTKFVLRRPPLKQVLASAHDMGREYKIISALGPTAIPVPVARGLCTDESVNERPFYVMEYVDGNVVRDLASAEEISLVARKRSGQALVETLARIHSIDVDAVGLGDLGKKEDYIARQLKRWNGQWEKSKTAEVPVVDEAYRLLQEGIPDQGPAAIVHGDYRLDNCMIDDDGEVVAVLDWEICTLGDPLADLGLLMVYWTDAAEDFSALPDGPTTAEGFATKAELLAAYGAISDRDLSQINYYTAFGYWKLACIIQGVYARYAGGAMGEAEGFEVFAVQVELLGNVAVETLKSGGSS